MLHSVLERETYIEKTLTKTCIAFQSQCLYSYAMLYCLGYKNTHQMSDLELFVLFNS